jgi:hypothetical protein
MKQKRIIFFSSDASDLYKADIFRVLALPDGYTIQFRYERQYVLEEFREKPEQLKSRQAVIFFLAGNDLSKPAAERKLRPYPIRSCKVKDAFLDKNTDKVILILELSDFVNCVIDPVTDVHKLPPNVFVSEVEMIDFRSRNWIDRVKAVEEDFPDILFYQIANILRQRTVVVPSYSADRRASFFELEEESEYSVECSCYDRAGGRSPLQIRYQSADIDLSNPFESGARARSDTRRLPLTTRTLKSRSAPASFTFFSPTHKDDPGPFKDPNHVEIAWRLTRKWWKTWVFGSLTALAAVGLIIIQTSLTNPSATSPSLCEVLTKLVGVLLIAIAAAQLFKFFNKT